MIHLRTLKQNSVHLSPSLWVRPLTVFLNLASSFASRPPIITIISLSIAYSTDWSMYVCVIHTAKHPQCSILAFKQDFILLFGSNIVGSSSQILIIQAPRPGQLQYILASNPNLIDPYPRWESYSRHMWFGSGPCIRAAVTCCCRLARLAILRPSIGKNGVIGGIPFKGLVGFES
jgi:hypothetical protein